MLQYLILSILIINICRAHAFISCIHVSIANKDLFRIHLIILHSFIYIINIARQRTPPPPQLPFPGSFPLHCTLIINQHQYQYFLCLLLYLYCIIFAIILYFRQFCHCSHMNNTCMYLRLPVWRDRVKRLATDPVVMRSSPATGRIHCALLANQPK